MPRKIQIINKATGQILHTGTVWEIVYLQRWLDAHYAKIRRYSPGGASRRRPWDIHILPRC